MILSSIKKAAFKILFNPLTLIPVILVIIFSYFAAGLMSWAIERPLIDFILYYETYAESNLLFVVLTQYPLEILTMFVVGMINLVVTSIALLSVARIVKGDGIVDAINDSVLEWKKATALAFFLIITFFVGIVAFLLLGAIFNFISDLIPQSGGILVIVAFPIIMAIIYAIIILKLIFVIPALVKENVKKAFVKSWQFTDGKLLSTIIFIALCVIIVYILMLLAENAALLMGESYEPLILSIGDIIATTFFGLAVSYYYYD
jgi:hypothetical protein